MDCFTYEFEFFSQLVDRIVAHDDLHAQKLLFDFRHTLRFVDDLFSAGNEVFKDYKYNSQMDNQGIKGIYPDFLQLACEQESRSKASFLMF